MHGIVKCNTAVAKGEITEEKRKAALIKISDAEEIAWAMDDWRKGQTAEPVPVEVEQPQRYSGSTMGLDELAAKARFDRIKGACRQLHNSVAECTEAAEALGGETDALQENELAVAISNIKSVAQAIEPKRASYAFRQ